MNNERTASECDDARLGRSMRDVDVDAIARVDCGRKRAAVQVHRKLSRVALSMSVARASLGSISPASKSKAR